MENHKFLASSTDPLKCAKCKWDEKSHGPEAICESCPNVGPTEIFGDTRLCRECMAKEIQTALDYQSPEKQEARLIEHNETLRLARQIDNSIQTIPASYNAATVSFEDINKAIRADETIPADQKDYKLAEMVKERILHFKAVFFEHNEIAVNAATQQRAGIQYLNTLANRLKDSERKALQIADINYKPEEVTKIKAPKKIKIKTTASQADLRKAAAELGLESTHSIALVMTARQTDIAGAIAYLKELQAKAKAEVPQVVEGVK